MDGRIRALAEARGGYFNRVDAIDCGYSDSQLRAAVREQHLRRLRHGTYALAETYDALTPERRHLVRARSVVAGMPGLVALSHRSGSVAYGHDQWGWDMSVVDVTRLDGGTGRREAGVVHHEGVVTDDDLVDLDGLLVLSEERVTVESTLVLDGEAGLVTVDAALRSGRLSRLDLERRLATYERWRGALVARATIRRGDGRSESVGESRGRHLFWRYAVPAPDLQVSIRDADGRMLGRVDYAWLDHCHVGEFDGMRKYTRDLGPGEDAGVVVTREKRREDQIRRESLGMSRLIWADIDRRRSALTARRLRTDMAESRRLYAQPAPCRLTSVPGSMACGHRQPGTARTLPRSGRLDPDRNGRTSRGSLSLPMGGNPRAVRFTRGRGEPRTGGVDGAGGEARGGRGWGGVGWGGARRVGGWVDVT